MELGNVNDYWAGWFVGNFDPVFFHSREVEISLKRLRQGEIEPRHYQVTATEISLIVSGHCRIGDTFLGPNEILKIEPNVTADFEAITDVVIVAIKFPSIPNDKRLGEPN